MLFFYREKLFGGTVPPNKTQRGGPVQANKMQHGGTVTPNKTQHSGTVEPNKMCCDSQRVSENKQSVTQLLLFGLQNFLVYSTLEIGCVYRLGRFGGTPFRWIRLDQYNKIMGIKIGSIPIIFHQAPNTYLGAILNVVALRSKCDISKSDTFIYAIQTFQTYLPKVP